MSLNKGELLYLMAILCITLNHLFFRSIGADHVQDHVIAILRALNHLEMVVDIVKIDEKGKSDLSTVYNFTTRW